MKYFGTFSYPSGVRLNISSPERPSLEFSLSCHYFFIAVLHVKVVIVCLLDYSLSFVLDCKLHESRGCLL